MQSIYRMAEGAVVSQGDPLVTGLVDVAPFDPSGVIEALQADQAGQSTFGEFVSAIWQAGVVRYEVDLNQRTCTYYGCNGESYREKYPLVDILTSTSV